MARRASAPAAPRPQLLAFLRDIKENAEDDTPRLVLADWLQEHGGPADAARGEFIRIQCERFRLAADDPRRRELAKREELLLQEHGAAWLGPLKYPQIRAHFERGLLHLVVTTQTLFSQRVLRLVGSEIWAWVGGLAIWGGGRTEDRTQRLVPFLAGLTDLTLRSARLGAGALQLLTQQADLGNLRTLCLPTNHIGTGGATALSHSPKLNRLTLLDLSSNEMHPNAVKALGDAGGLTSLTTLLLVADQLRDRGVTTLAATMRLPRLRELDLSLNSITDTGVAALTRSPLLAQLTTLNLTGNPVGDEGIAALAAAPGASNLTEVILRNTRLGLNGAEALANSPHLGQLRRLVINTGALREFEQVPTILRARFGDRLVLL